jgi:hypothetical protein
MMWYCDDMCFTRCFSTTLKWCDWSEFSSRKLKPTNLGHIPNTPKLCWKCLVIGLRLHVKEHEHSYCGHNSAMCTHRYSCIQAKVVLLFWILKPVLHSWSVTAACRELWSHVHSTRNTTVRPFKSRGCSGRGQMTCAVRIFHMICQ